jgi:hypothetical protein
MKAHAGVARTRRPRMVIIKIMVDLENVGGETISDA